MQTFHPMLSAVAIAGFVLCVGTTLFALNARRADRTALRHLSRLASVARATASAVIITDIAGVIVWVNDGFTRITGFSSAEAIGRIPGQLLQAPNANREEAERVRFALSERRSVAAEFINHRKDGRTILIGMKIEPLLGPSGECDGFMAIGADITERHERRRALDLLTSRFNLATRVARVGIYERDVGAGTVWWSEVMFEIFGQDPATFTPDVEGWAALIHAEDRARAIANGGAAHRYRIADSIQYRIVRPDGSVRHVQSIASSATQEPIDGADSAAAIRIVGIALDVTERVEAEARERVLQEQLRASSHQAGMAEIATGVLHNVGNVLNSLGIANATARRHLKSLRVERLQTVAAMVGENRASLAAFFTEDPRGRHLPEYLPALAAGLASSTESVQVEMDMIETLLNHLRDIVSAQQAHAQGGGAREPVNLRDIVESALAMQAPELGTTEIVRDYAELAPVTTDRHKLLQILVNFVSNARDAVSLGGESPGRITVELRGEDEHAVISVIDSGIGMSESVMANLWRFGYTTKVDGHGFGLHNSANAAQEIGATIAAFSDGAGAGSRFVLRLPLEAA
jgi:PAS domain S-box-containing protein